MFDLVIFPLHDWNKCQSQGLMRRDTQIIQGLELVKEVNRILIINRPVSPPMIAIDMLRGRRSFAKGGRLVQKKGVTWLKQISLKTFVLDTLVPEPLSVLALRKKWWPHILEQESFLAGAREAARFLDMEAPILWLFTPISTPAIGVFNEQFVVFDALDNWIEHEGMSAYREAAIKGYARIKCTADLVFSCAQHMQNFLSGGKPKVYWVPNGVDTSIFRPNKVRLPHDVEPIGTPRIGYIGAIDSRLDIELLQQCAGLLPDKQFLLVGPNYYEKRPINALRKRNNVHFLPQKRYDEIPDYINTFDVCLIPHKVNPYTNGMNPLKLYEYLACGKPIVSTPVAGTDLFPGLISTHSNSESFAEAIVQSLEKTSTEDILKRTNAVTEHSWDNRISFMWGQVRPNLRTLSRSGI